MLRVSDDSDDDDDMEVVDGGDAEDEVRAHKIPSRDQNYFSIFSYRAPFQMCIPFIGSNLCYFNCLML